MRFRKYNARPSFVDGLRFASAKEADRYRVLRDLAAVGAIRFLQLQPRFPIVVNGIHCGCYVADFRYLCRGRIVVEDVKGVRTPTYKLKKRLVEALYKIEIFET